MNCGNEFYQDMCLDKLNYERVFFHRLTLPAMLKLPANFKQLSVERTKKGNRSPSKLN